MSILMPDGFAITEYETLISTNLQAQKLAQQGQTGPLVIFTKNQTNGRGRNGRTWLSSSDALTATFLISSKAPKQNVAQLAFVMAVAAHKTVCDFIEPENYSKIGLKWPNDILVKGRKLAGILIESFNNSNNADSILSIGIGINIGDVPDNSDFSAISMQNLNENVTLETMLSKLAFNFSESLDIWADSKGFATIRQYWLKHAIGLGGDITARLPNQTLYGVFERLDENGILMLRDKKGMIHPITAGDIFIGHI